jgi:hypothetical protein
MHPARHKGPHHACEGELDEHALVDRPVRVGAQESGELEVRIEIQHQHALKLLLCELHHVIHLREVLSQERFVAFGVLSIFLRARTEPLCQVLGRNPQWLLSLRGTAASSSMQLPAAPARGPSTAPARNTAQHSPPPPPDGSDPRGASPCV